MCLFETFIETFVGLKKGYEEFGAEVGVRPLSGGSPLHRARSSREVIDYLLDPAADTEARSRDLRAVFADMGIHHIAFMEGLTQEFALCLNPWIRAPRKTIPARAYSTGRGPRLSGAAT